MTDVVVEISSGDRLRALIALRDELARRLPDAPSRELPVIARRLQSLLEEIEKLSVSSEKSFVDVMRERRDERLAAAYLAFHGENTQEGEMTPASDHD